MFISTKWIRTTFDPNVPLLLVWPNNPRALHACCFLEAKIWSPHFYLRVELLLWNHWNTKQIFPLNIDIFSFEIWNWARFLWPETLCHNCLLQCTWRRGTRCPPLWRSPGFGQKICQTRAPARDERETKEREMKQERQKSIKSIKMWFAIFQQTPRR